MLLGRLEKDGSRKVCWRLLLLYHLTSRQRTCHFFLCNTLILLYIWFIHPCRVVYNVLLSLRSLQHSLAFHAQSHFDNTIVHSKSSSLSSACLNPFSPA